MKYLTRISYNSHNWSRPSGPAHKAKGSNAFEAIFDFGFEEWLFDEKHQVDGYQYGYIEGLNTFFGNQPALAIPLVLFTLQYSQLRERPARRSVVTEIKKWEFLHSWKTIVTDHTTQRKWRDGMLQDLTSVLFGQKLIDAQNQIAVHFNALENNPKPLFNVRFRLDNVVEDANTSVDLHSLNRFKLYRIE